MANEEKIVSIKIQTPTETAGISKLTLELDKLSKRRSELLKIQRDFNKGVKNSRQLTEAERKELGVLQPTIVATRNKLRDLERTVVKNNNALKKNSGFVAGVRNGMKKAVGSIALYAGGFLALGRALTSIASVVKNFNQAQADLRSVTGRTKEELSGLTQQAKDLGATTKFTASEVTELQIEFAKLGFSTQEISNATEATLSLAAASGTDLANAASIAGATVRGFGLDTKETQRVVDVMANSFTKTSLDIGKFQTAMGIVAPVAASANVSIEETTALLGTLTDAGIDASTAGTGLRNVFLELTKKGLTFEEAMTMIQNATDKNSVALDLFGKRGATIGTVLASNTQKTADLTVQLNKSGGAAEKMAKEQLNTLNGSLQLLNSAWEGFILSLEEGDGVIAKLVTGALNGLAKGLTQLTNIGAILEVTFKGVDDASEQALQTMIKNADALNVTLDSGMKFSEFIKEFDEISLEELEAEVDRFRIQFSRLAEQQGENTEESTRMFNAYLNLRRASEQSSEATATDTQVINENTDAKKENAGATREMSDEEKARVDRLIRLRREAEQRELDFEEQVAANKKRLMEEGREEEKLMLEAWEMEDEEEEAERLDKSIQLEIEKEQERQRLLREQRQAQVDFNIAIAQQTANTLSLISEAITNKEVQELKRRRDLGIISEKKYQKELNEIQRKAFIRDKALKLVNIAIDTAAAISKSIALSPQTFGSPFSIFAAAQGVAQAAIVASQRFEPQEFAEGGLLQGRSHAEGGIPLTVGGQGGFEAEGGEAIINKKSTSMFKPLLSAINEAGGGVAFDKPFGLKKFAVGGITPNVGNNSDSLVKFANAMNARIDRIKVVNVASETASTANVVNNIQNDVSFG